MSENYQNRLAKTIATASVSLNVTSCNGKQDGLNGNVCSVSHFLIKDLIASMKDITFSIHTHGCTSLSLFEQKEREFHHKGNLVTDMPATKRDKYGYPYLRRKQK